jgi:hypothetical protein
MRARRPVLLKPSNRTWQYALDSILCANYNVQWTPRLHANVRPQTTHGKGFQIWRVAPNILNQQLRRDDKRSVAPCGLNGNLKIPSVKEQQAIKHYIFLRLEEEMGVSSSMSGRDEAIFY